jgi:hypothetical protein
MIKVERISAFNGTDNVVENLNKFFLTNNLSKSDIVHISTVNNAFNLIEFYIIYDDDEE